VLNNSQIQKAADDLYAAEANREQIDPLTLTHPDMDMEMRMRFSLRGLIGKLKMGAKLSAIK